MLFLQPEKVEWVEAEKDYVRLHVGKETHLVRETMNSFEKKLESRHFCAGAPLDHRKPGFCQGNEAASQRRIRHRDARWTPLRLSRGYRSRIIELLRDSF